MKPQTSPASFQTPASDSGLAFFFGGGGVGGGVCGKKDDDIVMPTPRTTSPEELGIYSTFVTSAILYSCQAYLWTLLRCLFAFARAFSENSKLVGGKLFYSVFKVLHLVR